MFFIQGDKIGKMVENASKTSLDNKTSLFRQFLDKRIISNQIEVSTEMLPPIISLSLIDEAEISRHHSTALRLWNDSLRENALEEAFETIINNPSEYTNDINQRLKNARVTGVILRDINCLFTQDHRNPILFFEFIKKLGKFNDNFDSKRIDLSPEVLLTLFKNTNEENKISPVFCSIQSVNVYMRDEVSLIREYIKSQSFSLKTYHDLRKKNRVFLDYFLIKTLQNPFSSEFFNIYTFLRKINTELGNYMNDKKNQNIEEEDYHIPKHIRELINSFFNRVVL